MTHLTRQTRRPIRPKRLHHRLHRPHRHLLLHECFLNGPRATEVIPSEKDHVKYKTQLTIRPSMSTAASVLCPKGSGCVPFAIPMLASFPWTLELVSSFVNQVITYSFATLQQAWIDLSEELQKASSGSGHSLISALPVLYQVSQ